MTDYRAMERELVTLLGLTRRPVAVTFRDAPPPGVPAFAGTEPSGCSFWRIAGQGRTFYTVPRDHHNGSHVYSATTAPESATSATVDRVVSHSKLTVPAASIRLKYSSIPRPASVFVAAAEGNSPSWTGVHLLEASRCLGVLWRPGSPSRRRLSSCFCSTGRPLNSFTPAN